MWGLNAKVAHLYLKNLRRRSFMEEAISSTCSIKSLEGKTYFKEETVQVLLPLPNKEPVRVQTLLRRNNQKELCIAETKYVTNLKHIIHLKYKIHLNNIFKNSNYTKPKAHCFPIL
jgi:hypothetical protein